MPMDVTPGLMAKPVNSAAPAKPAQSFSHGSMIRGLAAGANPGQPFGRFGPMFDLPKCPSLDDDGLRELAKVIVKIDDGAPIVETEPVDENNTIPAGYTYFGQFVDHDITFDPTPLSVQRVDRDALVDFRTPALDLDNMYGRGPADQPYMYEKDGLRLRVGTEMNTTAAPISAKVGTKHDLLRLGGEKDDPATRVAILGDKRNDENKIVSQLHGAMIAFHNKVVTSDAVIDQFGGDRSTKEARFQAAATIVRWHYQYVVLNDFLQRICEPGMVDEVLNQGGTPRLQNYLKQEAEYAYMPLEFAGAAYRLGHSMVRPSYSLNGVVLTRQGDSKASPPVPPGNPAKERIPTFSRATQGTENLNGFPGTLPAFWGIDWSFFLDDVEPKQGGTAVDVPGEGKKPVVIPQPSYRIDAQIVEPLADLPEFFDPAVPPGSGLSIAGNLAFRNLKRGQLLGLPSGQAIATKLGITPLPDDIVWGTGSRIPLPENADQASKDAFKTTNDKRQAFKAKFVDPAGAPLKNNAPLWYYVLREAEYYGVSKLQQDGVSFGGQHLGPVGSRIVAETFVGLLWLDQTSFLHSGRGFQPLPIITGGQKLTLGRLITWALA